jgi:hypothetical protein
MAEIVDETIVDRTMFDGLSVVTEGFLGTPVNPLALFAAVFKSIKTHEHVAITLSTLCFTIILLPSRENRIQSCKTVRGYGIIELESFISEL